MTDLRSWLRDLAGLSGCGMIAGGAAMIYPAAGLIVGGVLVLSLVVLSTLGERAR